MPLFKWLRRIIMNIVLKNQVEASEKSAQELEEEISHTHGWALLCYNVQDLSRSAVNLLSEIGIDVERWQRDLADNAQQDSQMAQLGSEWENLYRRLAGVFEKTAGLLHRLETEGFAIDGKPEFLAAWKELRGIVCFSVDGVAKSVEQARRGQTRSLGDIELELRDLPDNRG